MFFSEHCVVLKYAYFQTICSGHRNASNFTCSHRDLKYFPENTRTLLTEVGKGRERGGKGRELKVPNFLPLKEGEGNERRGARKEGR